MDPISGAALAAKATTPILGALGARQQAGAAQDQANINAYIGRTRALQSDTVSRQSLDSDIGSMRAAMGANGQRPNVGTFEMFKKFRETKGRERNIEFGNNMLQSAQFRTEAANAGAEKNLALPLGVTKAGPSLFDIYQLYS